MHSSFCQPDTYILDTSKLDKNHEYIVVAATDGLVDYDRLSTEEVALSMAKAMSSQSIRGRSSSMQAATQLILKASQLWDRDPMQGGYRDDISIAAHKLIV